MKRALLISVSLVLALVSYTTVCADDGFYVIGGGSIRSKVFAMGVINYSAGGYTVSNGKNISSAVYSSGSVIIQFTSGNYNVQDHLTLITPIDQPNPPGSGNFNPTAVCYAQGGTNAVSVTTFFNSSMGPGWAYKSFSIIVFPPN